MISLNRKPKLRAWAAILIIGWLSSVVACAHTRGSDIGTLRHDGLKREYILYRPSALAAPAIERPLLVVLHGGGGTYKHMLRLTSERFNQLAERDGFFVVYPQGIDKSWKTKKDPADCQGNPTGSWRFAHVTDAVG